MFALSFLVLGNRTAHADYSAASYGGSGMMTVDNGTPISYTGGDGGTGYSVSCSGAIRATFSWMGTAPLPQSVIVAQTGTASATAASNNYQTAGAPMAACADGLGDTGTIATTYPAPTVEVASGSATKTKYTVQSGSATITLTCSPSASVQNPVGQETATASVGFNAHAYAVTINPTGATLDSNGNYDLLVGQQFTPTLQCSAPGTFSSWQWTVSDSGRTFQSWTPGPPEVDGPGTLNVAMPSWYWDESTTTTATVSCTATFTPPAGQGSAFTVTAKQPVTVYIPAFVANGSPGIMLIDTNCVNDKGVVCLYAGPYLGSGEKGGMNFSLMVATPTTPVAFGVGQLELVQLVEPNLSYVTNETPPVTHTDVSTTYADDTKYPNAQGTESSTPLVASDSPALPLEDAWTFAQMSSKFTDFLMYQPPPYNKTSKVSWVPLAQFGWSTNGSATEPAGGWENYMGSPGQVTGSSFSASNKFPTWTTTDGPTVF